MRAGMAAAHLGVKVVLNVGRVLLHARQHLGGRRSHDCVDFLYLVHLVGAREQGKQADHLHKRQEGTSMSGLRSEGL